MSKVFVGTYYTDPVRYRVGVRSGGVDRALTHRVEGVDTNFRWDGGGPGSTDLARALLWHATGVEPAWRTYRLFKNDVVATWPLHPGECWRISDDEIKLWLAAVELATSDMETSRQTETRLEQSRRRDFRLQGIARMMRRGW